MKDKTLTTRTTDCLCSGDNQKSEHGATRCLNTRTTVQEILKLVEVNTTS